MLGNILLGIVSFCTFISYFPQTIKLLKTKKSEDISIQSWILWVTSSFSYTLY
ncbi:PQ-loop repeat-containing protein, partial [bacterium]|nr:PQ-loop repeat-containing protein [bacterium]